MSTINLEHQIHTQVKSTQGEHAIKKEPSVVVWREFWVRHEKYVYPPLSKTTTEMK